MADEEKGPSKNELKKLAKKAEKAAKKQNAKAAAAAGGGDGQPQTATQGGTAPSPAPAPVAEKKEVPIPPAPKLVLANASADCLATLKAVWAAQLCNVKVGVAKKKDFPSGFDAVTKQKPALVYGSDIVLGGGGNAMAKAISLIGGFGNPIEADELCEMEHSKLRGEKLDTKTLDLLSAMLEAKSGVHLLGGEVDSVADICVVVSLSKHATTMDTWPANLQTYYKAHLPALESAKAAVPDYIPKAFDMSETSLVKVLNGIFANAIEEVFPTVEVPTASLVSKCSNPKHGDFQCMAAMPIFASMKKSGAIPDDIKAPPQVAEAIIKFLGPDHPVVGELTTQGPGFILCRIRASYLQTHVQALLKAKQLPKPKVAPQQCVVDFSSPNIAKEMHVGHLRSTIIGESVCRLLEFAGHKVERLNHVGDWGTQFGMLIQYLKEEYPDFSSSMPNITDLTAFYKSAKEKFDADPEFKKVSQTNVVKLQGGDEECRKIWNILCDVSRMEFKKVYDRLDVTVEERGESFYNDKIPAVIDEFDKAKMISIEEGGAKCVFVDNFKIPLMLQKSDGGYGYDSTDMAALKHRLQVIKAQRVIVITDFSQGDHFKMCYAAAHAIGWVKDGQKLEHIGFGTVQGEDGKRFKTRSGDTVRLVDLLDESVNRMETSLKERIAENKANITLEEVHGVAEAIGYGAVKYFDLRRNPTTNYKFSYDQMLDTKGNTAVYLLYARVRLESICAKAKAEHNVDVEELVAKETPVVLEHASERNLALQLQAFTDTLELSLDDLFPYHICEYVYNLSIAASDFVTQCKVLGSPEMESRLLLCYVTTVAMRQCFDLLGIRHVKRI